MLSFPNHATATERKANWPQIAEIKDADLGFDTPRSKTDKTRFCVRALLRNDQNQFCIIKSTKYGYTQIPGGSIEEGETIITALRRETREETGYLIKNIQPIGFVVERREDLRNKHSWDRSISFVFTASPEKSVGTDYMPDEIAEGFQPVWQNLDEFISEHQNVDKITSYSGSFANRRDLEIAKYFVSINKSSRAGSAIQKTQKTPYNPVIQNF